VDRLRVRPDVEACRLPDGTGKKVGVCGRDKEGDGNPFPPESLGFGSRNPPVLMAKEFDPELRNPVLRDGDIARTAEERNKGVIDGFDSLRLSFTLFSFSFCGEGGSSMIKTQPAVSSLFANLLSDTLSLLRRDSTLFLWDSQLVLAVEAFEVTDDEELMGVFVPMTLCRPVRLAIRRRGTRVWIFCSRLRTLARISDTICTPLFFANDPEDEVLRIEEVRVAGGRIRPRADAGEGIKGCEVERMMLVVVFNGIGGDAFSATAFWVMKDTGTAGRDSDALGVVIVLSG